MPKQLVFLHYFYVITDINSVYNTLIILATKRNQFFFLKL